ncbi:type II restriction enzyme [Corynebacterium lizhenjunii]|nr:hypothetical protein [Corynebacterium lizhenjunii]
MGANDVAWDKVLAHYCQPFEISARELEHLGQRQPRLLAKHDFSAAVPAGLRQRGWNVLPISRSNYAVGPFQLFQPFPEIAGPIRHLSIPAGLESINVAAISSEAQALNVAAAAGIFEDFLDSPGLVPTVAGRMSTHTFTVHFSGVAPLTIDRAQMEIDAGFESARHVVLVEAKNHLTSDFNVRQLYFPYRRFSQALAKPVIPVFMVYSNGLFRVYRFRFADPLRPESIELADAACYTVGRAPLDVDSALAVLSGPVYPTDLPFPQANSFERLINLGELLLREPLSKAEITQRYDFDPRQAAYYAEAGRYLGLFDLRDGCYELSAEGGRIFAQTERSLALVRAMGARPVFREVLVHTLRTGRVPPVAGFMAAANLGLSESTLRRRASTVSQWAQWVLQQTQWLR